MYSEEMRSTKRISFLNHYKIPVCMTFAFILGCMISFSIIPLDRTCTISDNDRDINIKQFKSQNPELIILILSGPNNFGTRNTVRKTWLSLSPSDQENIRDTNKFRVKHLFVIGQFNLNKKQMTELEKEQSEFEDLLFVPMQDSYANLTLKVLKSFEWLDEQLDYGLDFKYVLKCDDDSFVRLDSLLHELKHMELLYLKSSLSSVQKMSSDTSSPYLRINIQTNNYETRNNLSLYWGYFDGRANIQQKGKWTEHNWIFCDKYIPYALGGGYIVSKKLVTFIAKNSDHLRLFNAEDVSVGVWLSTLNNIIRIHDIRFDTEWISRGCQNFFLISHPIKPQRMQEMMSNLQSHNEICTNPYQKRNFYHYNWSSLPSQCCQGRN